MKLKPEDLDKITERMRSSTALREGACRAKITVHMGTCGIATGARGILKAFLAKKEENRADDVLVTTSGCAGLCSHEPMATIQLEGEPPVKYAELTEEKVGRIFDEHVMGRKMVKELALAIGNERII
ncbi:MAG: (2Fe-2S) ferredoxin domain-containing protein [Spirochaetales bacterium]|nr:(2Fe-2S) ferredoxin domain-containing protein [Spirochaetales bacterium]